MTSQGYIGSTNKYIDKETNKTEIYKQISKMKRWRKGKEPAIIQRIQNRQTNKGSES